MSKNSKLFAIGQMESVDIETGVSTPVEGGHMLMLPGAKGSCEWCHVVHDPKEPHNKQSLPYQFRFYTIHGRFVTWTDAMAHCSDEVKAIWRKHLVEVMKQNNMPIPDDLKEDNTDV